MGIHISDNKKIEDDMNFTKTIKSCNVINRRRMRKLILESKTTISKSLAISKIVHLPIKIKVPNILIEELKKIRTNASRDKKKQNKTDQITQLLQRWWFKECRYRT